MKRLTMIALAASLVLSISGMAHAQSGLRIALIDVGYIFKNHHGFKAMREALENEVSLANVDFKVRRDRLEQNQQTLMTLKKGAPDYPAKEAELAQEAAKLNAELVLERNKFSEREAAIYYQVYQEVRDATAAYCKQNGINVAMQFNGAAVDTENSAMVQAEVARKIVYYDGNLDITPAVLQMLNNRTGGTANANVGGPRRQQ